MSLFNRGDKGSDPPEIKTPTPKPETRIAEVLPPLQRDTHVQVAAPQAAAQTIEIPVKPVQAQNKQGANMASVISKALKITGELESTEDIQIDGQIEGDVRGVGVKIGQNAKVKGTVYGDEVELAGTVEGRIESKRVILAGTARMTGDVCHQDIKIESGAYISGSLKPEMGKPESKLDSRDAKAKAAIITPAPKEAQAAGVHH